MQVDDDAVTASIADSDSVTSALADPVSRLLPSLKRHAEAGRKIRMFTTTCTGSTELKALEVRQRIQEQRRAAGIDQTSAKEGEALIGRGIARLLHLDDQERIGAYQGLLSSSQPPRASDLDERTRRRFTKNTEARYARFDTFHGARQKRLDPRQCTLTKGLQNQFEKS